MPGDPAPFDFDGGKNGVLCIHGFTGTPFEMRFLGEQLNQRGLTVVGPALAGHCTSPEELDETGWRDWYAGVEREFDALRRRCDRVAVVGLSLGGALTLHLARHRGDDIAAIAALAAPMWLPRLGRAIAKLYEFTPLGRLMPAIPKFGASSDIRDPVMKKNSPSYPVMPGRAIVELDRFIRLVRSEVHLIETPALVMHARQDHSVPFACSTELARRLGSRTVRRQSLHGSFHVITVDIERDLVAAEVGTFFEEQFR